MKIATYGWRPDLPDHRDRPFTYSIPFRGLPPSVDLRPQCPPVLDQGQLGSCTAFAVGGGAEWFIRRKEGLPDFEPSPLFLYWDERRYEGTIDQDSGAQVREGLRSLAWHGACPESLWPYDIAKFTEKPPQAAWEEAAKHKLIGYQRIATGDLTGMKACLASGYPFVFGFTVYESFESPQVANTGIVPMPGWLESVLGGHAVMAAGYDDVKAWVICRNSWGAKWGDQGYFYLPYAYIRDAGLAGDFWTLRVSR